MNEVDKFLLDCSRKNPPLTGIAARAVFYLRKIRRALGPPGFELDTEPAEFMTPEEVRSL